MFCVSCGQKIEFTSRYCQNCGNKISSARPLEDDYKDEINICKKLILTKDKIPEITRKKRTALYWISYILIGVFGIGYLASFVIPLLAGSKPTLQDVVELSFIFGIGFAVRAKQKSKSVWLWLFIGLLVGMGTSLLIIFSLSFASNHLIKKDIDMYTSNLTINSMPLPESFINDEFTINYPSEWIKLTSPDSKTKLMIASNNGDGPAVCMVTVKPMSENANISSSDFVNSLTTAALASELAKKIPDISIEKSGKMKLSNGEAFRWDGHGTQDGEKIVLVQILTANDNLYYTLSCKTNSDSSSNVKETIDKIIESFSIVKM